MGIVGRFFGDVMGAFFPGAQGFVERAVDKVVERAKAFAREVVNAYVEETRRIGGRDLEFLAKQQRIRAENLAEEEKELAKKRERDGRITEADAERKAEIARERERLREDIDNTTAAASAAEIENSDKLRSGVISDTEAEGLVGLMSTKPCLRCGRTMTLQFEANNLQTGPRFKWVCSAIRPDPCPIVRVTTKELQQQQVSIREPHADLDASPQEREAWKRSDVLARTAGRVRAQLGEDDKAMICPRHLLPMKLMQLANADGRLFATYQYTCLAVDGVGRACSHTVPVKSFGQVSALLTRNEGRGIQ